MLQKNVNLMPVVGTVGQEVVIGQAIYASFNPLTDGTLGAGDFAFRKANVEDGVSLGLVSNVGTGAPIGIVERTLTSSIENVLNATNETYPEGTAVTVAIRGQFYAIAKSAGTSGQGVNIDPSNATITYGEPSGGAVATGWTVSAVNGGTDFAQNDIVIYEKF